MENREKVYICIILFLILLWLRSCNNATSTNTIKEHNNIGIKTYTKPILSAETVTKIYVKGRAVVSYDTLIKHDTLTNTDSIYIDATKPIYTLNFKDKWKSGTVIAKYDSVEVDAKFKDYSYVFFEQKRGVFKNKLIFSEIKQQNPNAIMQGVTHGVIKPKHKMFNVGVQSGVGIDLIRKRPTLYVGVGLGFDLLR